MLVPSLFQQQSWRGLSFRKLMKPFPVSCLLLLATSGIVSGQESTVAGDATEVQALVEQVQTVRRKRRQLEEDQMPKEERIQGQIARLEKELTQAKIDLEKAGKINEDLARTIRTSRQDAQAVRADVSQVLDAIRPVLRMGSNRISSGIPFRKSSRQDAWSNGLKKLITSELVEQADGLVDICQFYQEELRLAGSVKVWNAPVKPDVTNREIQAFQFRLGLCQQYFVAEDGSEIGVSAKGVESHWTPLTRREGGKQVLQALDILRERRAPDLVLLPLLAPGKPLREETGNE